MCDVRPFMWWLMVGFMSPVLTTNWIATPTNITFCEEESLDLVWIFPNEDVVGIVTQKLPDSREMEYTSTINPGGGIKTVKVTLDKLQRADSGWYEALVVFSNSDILKNQAVVTVLMDSHDACPSYTEYHSPLIKILINDKPRSPERVISDDRSVDISYLDQLAIIADIPFSDPNVRAVASIDGVASKTCPHGKCTLRVQLKESGIYHYTLKLTHPYRQASTTRIAVRVEASIAVANYSADKSKVVSDNEKESKQMSVGLIFGVTSAVVGICVIIVVVIICMKHRKKIWKSKKTRTRKNATDEEEGEPTEDQKCIPEPVEKPLEVQSGKNISVKSKLVKKDQLCIQDT